MNEKIYVIGHMNPDTDSICSAIAYAEYKKKVLDQGVEAYLEKPYDMDDLLDMVSKVLKVD